MIVTVLDTVVIYGDSKPVGAASYQSYEHEN